MTDKEIRELAEKTKQEKYCKLYCEKHDLCSDICPIVDIVDCLHCEDTIYKMAFLDGFKAAIERFNQLPHFPLKNDSDIERIEKFRDNPELCQTYLREFKDNIECVINGIIAREK